MLVIIANGPFTVLEAIYQMSDAERRAFVLFEILSEPVQMRVEPAMLRKSQELTSNPAPFRS